MGGDLLGEEDLFANDIGEFGFLFDSDAEVCGF